MPRKAHGLLVFRTAEGPTCDLQAARRTSLKCGNVNMECTRKREKERGEGVGSSHLLVGTRRAFLKQQVIDLCSRQALSTSPLEAGVGRGRDLLHFSLV